MSEKKEKVFLSEEVIKDLFSKQILKRNYEVPGTFIIDETKVVIVQSVLSTLITNTKLVKKVVQKDETAEWIQSWRELFPKGKNNYTNMLFRGDKQICLKNMKKFRKDYDFTKEEIFKITLKAIQEAEQANYEYFPAAHYFIHKQNVGSRLAQFGELYREGGSNETRGRTVI